MIEKIQDFIDKAAFAFLIMIPAAIAAFGAFLYVVEFYNFLRYGVRNQVSIYDLIYPFTVEDGRSPLHDWVGLTSILESVSINIVLIIFGCFWTWIIYLFLKSGKRNEAS